MDENLNNGQPLGLMVGGWGEGKRPLVPCCGCENCCKLVREKYLAIDLELWSPRKI